MAIIIIIGLKTYFVSVDVTVTIVFTVVPMRWLPCCTGVAREVRGCGPHRAALARGGKLAKIVF